MNCSKTKVMHFREKNLCRSQYLLCYEDHYTYLGITFEEHLNFITCAETLAAAVGKLLGSVISKYNSVPSVSCIMPSWQLR